MLRNFKPIIRNAFKNKGITLLNIFGLTIGLVCSIFLISWVIHESTYDSFVKEKEKIFRVVLDGVINGEPMISASCVSGIGPESNNLFPEVENYARLNDSYANSLINTSDRIYFRANGYAADSTFFELFPFPALEGDLSDALNVKNNIVINKQLAANFFGDEPAIGKQLLIREQVFSVSAVLDDIPSNSHLQFQFLVPTLNMPKWWHYDAWGGDNAITYLKLNTDIDIRSVSTKITDMVYGHNPFWKEFNVGFSLQNIKDIPFSGAIKWDYAQKSSKRNIYALSGIAFLIMLIACINFTNLFISSALKRKKAIGIKITCGAHKLSIIKEYLVEVFIYVFTSFVIAVVLLKLSNPYLNHLSGSVIDINYFSIRFIVISLPLIIITAILAGFFPGVYLTQFKPVDILKNSVSPKGNKPNIQEVLVTVQFVIAMVLVFSVVVIYKQVDFLQSKDLGFEKENVLYVHTVGKLKQKNHQNRLKNELMRNPNIINVAYREGLPTIWNNGLPISSTPDNKDIVGTEEIIVDESYFDLMDIAFIEGGNVFKHSHDSSNYCIVNEETIKRLNLAPPFIDKVVHNPDANYIIKGVIKNINIKALTQQVDPCIYREGNWQTENGILLFKLTSDYSEAIADIRTYWEKEVPDRPFEYWFLDQTYDKLYKSEIKAREVLSWFTVLALVLTSLGLLAMTYFITENRTKEIGIRKVNGAKVSEILTMLNKDFIKWVAIAFIVACPIAYYAMNKWLENFAYKTTLSWWIFALAGVLALGIALLTVSWQSWRAATRNPVEALRYE